MNCARIMELCWTDLSIYQAPLLPMDGQGPADSHASAATGSRPDGAQVRDETGWRDRSNYMRTSLGTYWENSTMKIVTTSPRISRNILARSPLPHSPAECRKYEQVKQAPFSDEAMKIVYVTYDMPGANRFPWSLKPERDGNSGLGVSRALVFKAGPKTGRSPNIDTRRRPSFEPYSCLWDPMA